MEDGEGRVDDAKVEFYEVISAVLNEGLNSVNFSCVLFDARVVCQEE